ncbi:hypothetical protein [Sphingomonas sp. PR090111-T3T-6A]|uniref:hypothetical protein n=1 Tax=Sphingomonas sp. PR090111-T3T-6A TaxID=685778 RepID=UPI00036B48D5|nr:hypothetical protein [Sphingomonas sp. PR090111-T3T-6A]
MPKICTLTPEDIELLTRPDLSAVPRHRQTMVRQRLDAIRRYESTPWQARGGGKREAGFEEAKRLGLTKHSFISLVRTWRKFRRPEAIMGARLAPRQNSPSPVPPQALLLIKKVICELGRHGPTTHMIREVQARAKREGIQVPCEYRLRHAILGQREVMGMKDLATTASKDLLITHCALDMQVRGSRGGSTHPIATLMAYRGQLLAIGLSLDPPAPRDVARILRQALSLFPTAERSVEEGPIALHINADHRTGWRELFGTIGPCFLRRGSTYEKLRAGQLAKVLLFSNDHGLVFRPGLTRRPEEQRMCSTEARASTPTLADAEASLQARLQPVTELPSLPRQARDTLIVALAHYLMT